MKTSDQVTLLMDGDTLAFIAAAAVQNIMEDDQGFVQPFAHVSEGEACIDNIILGLYRDLGAQSLMIYLSDPEGSWRAQLQASYKSNRVEWDEGRTAKVRPLLLGRLKEYLRAKYGAEHWPGLEADDVLGILMTEPKTAYPGVRVMVGKDKDFDTIPGLHHQIGRDVDASGRPIVREVTEDFADYWHLLQSFAGDRVDGYPGCPGVGMERAKAILEDPHELVPQEGRVTRGPRKGQTVTKWVKGNKCSRWRCIVSHYVAKGQTAKDAIMNARLAHILRNGDYRREDGTVTLWVPPEDV